MVGGVAPFSVPFGMHIIPCDYGTRYILFGDKWQYYNYQDAKDGTELVPAGPRSGRRVAGRSCPSLAAGPVGGVAYAQGRAPDEIARSRADRRFSRRPTGGGAALRRRRSRSAAAYRAATSRSA